MIAEDAKVFYVGSVTMFGVVSECPLRSSYLCVKHLKLQRTQRKLGHNLNRTHTPSKNLCVLRAFALKPSAPVALLDWYRHERRCTRHMRRDVHRLRRQIDNHATHTLGAVNRRNSRIGMAADTARRTLVVAQNVL